MAPFFKDAGLARFLLSLCLRGFFSFHLFSRFPFQQAHLKRSKATSKDPKAPSRHRKALSEIQKGPSDHQKGPSEVLKAPSDHQKGPSEVLKAPSDHQKGPSEVLKAPSDHLKGPSEVLKAPSDHLKGPSEVLKAPSDHLKGPSFSMLTEPFGKHTQWFGMLTQLFSMLTEPFGKHTQRFGMLTQSLRKKRLSPKYFHRFPKSYLQGTKSYPIILPGPTQPLFLHASAGDKCLSGIEKAYPLQSTKSFI
jgi:hypothetical protein